MARKTQEITAVRRGRGRPQEIVDPVRVHISVERADYERLQARCANWGVATYVRRLIARNLDYHDRKERAAQASRKSGVNNSKELSGGNKPARKKKARKRAVA